MASTKEISQLAQQYQEEFQRNVVETGDVVTHTAREAVSTIQQKVDTITPTALEMKDHFISIITNFSETTINYKEILTIMFWSSIMVLGCKIVATLTHYFLHPFVGLVFDGYTALYLTAIFIPVYVHFKQSREPLNDEKSRFRLLAYAGIQGITVGYIQMDSFLLSADPYAFVGLAIMGLSALFLYPILGGSRLNYLIGVVGSGFGFHFVLGLILGQLGFIYLLMALLYSAAAFILLQYYLQASSSKNLAHLYMYYNFVAVIYIQLVFFYIFGYTKDNYKKLIASEVSAKK
uniref:Chemotaxis protein n=1 Tax=Strongyloides stercoralis TaxID=6248 RepID=A0A0K0EN09_STRER